MCRTDHIDLVTHAAPCGTILTSTAMDSVGDKSVYFGPKAQWRTLRDRGCIDPKTIRCFTEEPHVLESKYVFAKKDTKMRHEFCVAVVTGKCYKGNGDGSGSNNGNERAKMFQDICPTWAIEVPL